MEWSSLISSLAGVLIGGAITIITQIIVIRTDLKTKATNSRRQYTKEERGTWRSGLSLLVKDGPENINLNHVRVLINPYSYDVDLDVMKDGHIWAAVNSENKELVYKYILLLLKFERERARYESLEKNSEKHYQKAKQEYITQIINIERNQKLNKSLKKTNNSGSII